MGTSPERELRSIEPLPTTPARPSRKTGRSGSVGGEVLHAQFPQLRPPEPVDPDLPVPTADMPRKGVRVARRRRLLLVAGTQHGLFTTAQAAATGLDRRARHHHLTYGNWRRTAAPHVFRIAGWPPDEHERLRCWLLWAGPGAHLTSWTALGLLGLVGSGPRVPVGLEIPFSHDRAGRRRRRTLLDQAAAAIAAREIRIHRPVRERTSELDGLRLRTPAVAICAAIDEPGSIALALAEDLLDRGHLQMSDLWDASRTTSCGRLVEVLFQRVGC